ncbi:MAG: serine/threonine protein phosphatase [Rhodobacterales bacterium]|nr:serine/threonine protein phosphatase [Rhodobacterales bacterium]
MVADSSLDSIVNDALAEPTQRVRRLDTADGRRFWLKRVERLSGRLRLQKGNPARTFEMERAGLAALAEAGIPVTDVVAEGPDWMLMPDAGPVLPRVVGDPGRSEDEKLAAFAAAGRTLGRLHWAGLVHGRPAVRDICWDGREARFIDLERFRHGRHGGLWQAADIVMFAQTCFTQWPEDQRWLDAALAAYGTNAPPDALDRVASLARWLAGPGVLANGLARLKPGSKELRAVGLTLARLRRA